MDKSNNMHEVLILTLWNVYRFTRHQWIITAIRKNIFCWKIFQTIASFLFSSPNSSNKPRESKCSFLAALLISRHTVSKWTGTGMNRHVNIILFVTKWWTEPDEWWNSRLQILKVKAKRMCYSDFEFDSNQQHQLFLWHVACLWYASACASDYISPTQSQTAKQMIVRLVGLLKSQILHMKEKKRYQSKIVKNDREFWPLVLIKLIFKTPGFRFRFQLKLEQIPGFRFQNRTPSFETEFDQL